MIKLPTLITCEFCTVKLGLPNSVFKHVCRHIFWCFVLLFFILVFKPNHLITTNQKLISESGYVLSVNFPWSNFIFNCGFRIHLGLGSSQI